MTPRRLRLRRLLVAVAVFAALGLVSSASTTTVSVPTSCAHLSTHPVDVEPAAHSGDANTEGTVPGATCVARKTGYLRLSFALHQPQT